MKRLAAPLGILLVFTSMAFGMDKATDFIPALSADPGTTKEPPNIVNNKTT